MRRQNLVREARPKIEAPSASRWWSMKERVVEQYFQETIVGLTGGGDCAIRVVTFVQKDSSGVVEHHVARPGIKRHHPGAIAIR
jgi:hypothetical protein